MVGADWNGALRVVKKAVVEIVMVERGRAGSVRNRGHRVKSDSCSALVVRAGALLARRAEEGDVSGLRTFSVQCPGRLLRRVGRARIGGWKMARGRGMMRGVSRGIEPGIRCRRGKRREKRWEHWPAHVVIGWPLSSKCDRITTTIAILHQCLARDCRR